MVTYQIRTDLSGANPPTWRRLELASDLNLARLHEIIQVVFGWTDSHLHGFTAGPDYYSRDAERYLCPFDVEEGEDGVPEAEVRLDEVLAEPGDTLSYAYDFGDGWLHLLKLEEVLSRDGRTARALCTGGRRDGPPEDCGGIGSYELICAATDPGNPDHADAVVELEQIYGDDFDPATMRTTPFDIGAVNDELETLDAAIATEDSLPDQVRDLVREVRNSDSRRTLLQLMTVADLAKPVLVNSATATRMVHPYAWLLERVGADGIKLTSAGYLPPAHVSAAFTELGLASEWYGQGNRENDTLPVLHLRESAQKLGLVRKNRGRLLLTQRGRALRADPVGMWWHLAEQMPVRSTDQFQVQAGLLELIAVAAGLTEGRDIAAAEILEAIGWRYPDGTPPTEAPSTAVDWDTHRVLRRLGAITDDLGRRSEQLTTEGVVFARAALRTWPAMRKMPVRSQT